MGLYNVSGWHYEMALYNVPLDGAIGCVRMAAWKVARWRYTMFEGDQRDAWGDQHWYLGGRCRSYRTGCQRDWGDRCYHPATGGCGHSGLGDGLQAREVWSWGLGGNIYRGCSGVTSKTSSCRPPTCLCSIFVRRCKDILFHLLYREIRFTPI